MKKKVFYTEFSYILGLLIMAFGAAFTEKSDFGVSMIVAPAYILHLKVSQFLPWFTFGVAEYCFQGLLVLVTVLIMGKFKLSYLFSFVTAILYGTLLDLAMGLIAPLPNQLFAVRVVWYILGTVLCSFAVSLFFHTYISPEAYELIVKELTKKLGCNINKVKTAYDCFSVVLSVAMSFLFFGFGVFEGIKWGTVICAVVNGFLIGRSSRLLEHFFTFENKFSLEKYFRQSAAKGHRHMNYKIIASDLDRTLLTDDHGISPENYRAIEQLAEKGVFFVPASGRAYDEMPQVLMEHPAIRYYIASDGGSIYDKKTQTMYELAMDQALCKDVLDVIYRYPICPMIHHGAYCYVDITTHNPADYAAFNMNRYWVSFCMEQEIPVENLREKAYDFPTIQSVVVFFKNMEDLEACRDIFSKDDRLLLAQTDPYNLEIFSCKAGKGNALHYLADLLNVDRAATIAVGDSTNDMTMVQAAGLGLAVENAVPALKEAADEIICHYHAHSAKYILEHYFSE